MAPIGDEVHKQVMDSIAALQAKVKDLEAHIELLQNPNAPKPTSEEVRMILIGPPGAGMLPTESFDLSKVELMVEFRQGYSSSKAQGKVLLLPLGRSIYRGGSKKK